MVASRGGAEGVWYNPSALFGKSSFDATLSRMAWIGETKNDFLSLVYAPGKHAVGLYANLLSTEDVYRDNLGNDGGKFSNGATALGGAYALQMGPVTLGLGGKYFTENIEAMGLSGYAFDLGGQIRAARGHLRFGAALQNAYAVGSYGSSAVGAQLLSKNSAVPCTLRGGFSLLGKGFALNLEGRFRPAYDERSISGGLEYALNAGSLGLAVRAGYDSAGLQVGDLAGIALGGGIVMDSLVADFAWLPQGVLGNPYRLSVGWRFGTTGPEFSEAKSRRGRRSRNETRGPEETSPATSTPVPDEFWDGPTKVQSPP